MSNMEFMLERLSYKYFRAEEKPLEDDRVYKKPYKDEFRWYIKINTVEELIELQEKEGELVITSELFDDKSKKLIICDDYLERE